MRKYFSIIGLIEFRSQRISYAITKKCYNLAIAYYC